MNDSVRVLTEQCERREDLGVFSGGLHEVSIAAIGLIDTAEKSGRSEAEKSRLIKTEKSGPNRWHKNRAKHVNRNRFNSDN